MLAKEANHEEILSFDLKLTNGDLSLSNSGDLSIVEGSDKLIQDVVKIITTQIGTNRFYPWYGSPISQTLIGTSYDERFVSAAAASQLRTSLDNLQRLQKEQLKTAQIVSPQEQIAAIQGISVERDITDPRFFRVTLTILSKAFQRVQTSLTIDPL